VLDPAVARRIRLVGLDVDGVLTDNGLYVGMVQGAPAELKRFDIQDGIGIVLLRLAGIRVVLLSGRRSEATDLRGEELAVDACVQGHHAQAPGLAALLERFGAWDEAAFLGDDLLTSRSLRSVDCVAVANATGDARPSLAIRPPPVAGERSASSSRHSSARGEWEATVERY
jgi:3-deoxy-D-manno-octulosonate 8-phosphate phosphatase (KDO 8-P phosphatase)